MRQSGITTNPESGGTPTKAPTVPAAKRRGPRPVFYGLHLFRRKPFVPHPELKSQAARNAGFTLLEVSTILSVLAILSVIIVPQVRGYVQSAQRVRAKSDLQSICNSMMLLMRDVGPRVFSLHGQTGTPTGPESNLRLLVGSGDIPELGMNGNANWLEPVNGTTVDFLDNYLVSNTPGGSSARRLPTPLDPHNGHFAWRGAYTSGPLSTDPWGNRYMINVQFLHPGSYEDVVVYSAGANEKVETEFARDGLIPGGDDLMFLLARDGGGGGGSKN